ncbi:MAG: hypothetical protein QXI93_04825, partial [Candidatus Methanomethylicia archaeon]
MFEELLLISVYVASGLIPIFYNYVIARRIAKKYYDVKPYMATSIGNELQSTSISAMTTVSRTTLDLNARESLFKLNSISSTKDGIS